MRHLIVFALKRLKGVNVVEADDGLDALKKLQSDKFDLLVTDINMPMMDGFKLVGMVRGDATTKDMPIVIITTEGRESDRQRAMALGVTLYLPKPVQAVQITQAIKGVLGL